MIHPSYVDLMKVVNKGVEEGETPVINSRYSIVMATAKRARQIVDGDDPMIEGAYGKKPLSIAVEELNEEKIRILSEEDAAAADAEAKLEAERLRASISAAEADELLSGEEFSEEESAESETGAEAGAEESDEEPEETGTEEEAE
ncbi:MAG: DNA-directed RNA polymerase subunit omega [Lachnospiraceae bacterium]|nr:DNA-directed RNA polymerase subunit omega [Lachnospiraceae bacterium]